MSNEVETQVAPKPGRTRVIIPEETALLLPDALASELISLDVATLESETELAERGTLESLGQELLQATRRFVRSLREHDASIAAAGEDILAAAQQRADAIVEAAHAEAARCIDAAIVEAGQIAKNKLESEVSDDG
jgi:cell division septum initiation protein DivIVA